MISHKSTNTIFVISLAIQMFLAVHPVFSSKICYEKVLSGGHFDVDIYNII